jgi:lysophospholipase L1-like esterase
MTNLSRVNAVRIPEGSVRIIKAGGNVIWNKYFAHYVSLGDSIAAGHTINDRWEADYGYGSQYGANGNASTAIVPGCYTDLIREELAATYGASRVSAKSFAHSGDTVADLMEKLTHATVIDAISKADIVTVCIGANDVLQPALHNLDEYISAGDSALAEIAAIVEANLSTLGDDSAATSYNALFNRLHEINPRAKYVFTTVYNPYKYLWADEGQNGFFAPLLNTIPDISLLGFDVDSMIKSGLLGTSVVQMLFDRVNGLCDWAEKYVTALNSVLRSKVAAFQAVNPNFCIADTKPVFESFPDRLVSASKHYNDLVNVEYTRGYDTAQMDWGALWRAEYGSNVAQFWIDLAGKYVSISGIDLEGFAAELINHVVNNVIVPDVDPHPEEYGHYVMKRSFADALGWQPLARYSIAYDANGGAGSMASQDVTGIGDVPAFAALKQSAFTAGAEGYRFACWNAKADGSGAAYSAGQVIGITSNATVYAQWSNICTVTVKHSSDAVQFESSQTGPMECYALWIDGSEQPDLGAFSNGARVYHLPYGTPIGVIAQTKAGSGRSYITFNGVTVAEKSSDARYGFNLAADTVIHFEWNQWFEVSLNPEISYWNCYITTL